MEEKKLNSKENIEEIKNKLQKLGVPDEFLKKPAFIEFANEHVDVNDQNLTLEEEDTSENGLERKIHSSKGCLIFSDNVCKAEYSDLEGTFKGIPSGNNVYEEIHHTDEGIITYRATEYYGFGIDAGLNFDSKYEVDKQGIIGNLENKDKENYIDFGFISYDDMVKNGVHVTNTLQFDDIMEKYDKHAEGVAKKYPEMKDFYETKRKEMSGILINILEKENQKLQQENQELKKDKEKLSKELAVTLDFAEMVQRSRWGKFFFRKQLGKLISDKNEERD